MNYKVSVLLPVAYSDKLKFIKIALFSILNQSCKDFQLILCIDGPLKNEIYVYLNTLNDKRIEIFRNDINIGLAAILNKAIKKYPSDIYVRMDADDISHKERIKKTMDIFKQDKDIMLVGTESMEIDEQGKSFFYKKLPSGDDILNWSYTRNPFIHSAISYRKELFENIGYYNENFKKSQDYEFIARVLIKKIKCTNIHEPLINVRIYSDFLKRRTLWVNIINEAKVSLMLINHFRAYNHLPKLFTKFSMRVLLKYLPVYFSKLAYKRFR